MIAISTTLEAHQQGAARSPHLRAIARHARFGVALFPWTRLYDGAEPDSPHAVTVTADGSLIRLRNDAGTLRLSRVANPGPASDFSSWAAFGTAASGTGVALSAHSDGETLALYVTGSPARTLTYRRSTDNGQTWGAATTIVTEAADIQWVAIAHRPSNGDACAFYSQDPSTIKRLRRTAGSWAGSGTSWTLGADVGAITGVAASHDGADYPLAVTGEDTAGYAHAWACRLVDSGGLINFWGAKATVDLADPDATLTFHAPAIAIANNDPHVYYAAREAGDVAVDRAFHVHPPHGAGGVAYPRWSFPEPHEAESAYGLAVARAGDATWAATAAGVWRATHAGSLDLTPRLVEATYELTPGSASGRATFDNSDGTLTPPPPALTVGGQLELTPGYRSGVGGAPEYGAAVHLEVSRLEQGRDGRLHVYLGGAWETMGRRRAPVALQVDARVQSRALTAETLTARAGILLTSSGGTAWMTHTPGFALPPGGSVAAALGRVLAVAEEVLTPNNDALKVRTPHATPDYAYGPGEHPVKWFTKSHAPPAANWARAQGPDRYADAVSFASVYAHGATLSFQRAADATTDQKATDYAAGELAKSGRAITGTLCVPVNAGAELWDVVTVSDDVVAPDAADHRVVALRLDFTRALRKAPAYQHTFTLGEV